MTPTMTKTRSKIPMFTLMDRHLAPRDAKLPKPVAEANEAAWDAWDAWKAAQLAEREARDTAKGTQDPDVAEALARAEQATADAEREAKSRVKELFDAALPHRDSMAESYRERVEAAEGRILAALNEAVEGWVELESAAGAVRVIERFEANLRGDSLSGFEGDSGPFRRALERARQAIERRASWRNTRPAVEQRPAEAIAALEYMVAREVGKS